MPRFNEVVMNSAPNARIIPGQPTNGPRERSPRESARSLTDAPYAVIITLDASGAVEDHLVLGLEPDDVERLWQAPQGRLFFEYLNALPGPLRVGHLEEFTGSIGLGEFRSPVQITAFMAAPILLQGAWLPPT